ncbi:MAG: hypothetical protein KAG06_02805 [Methylococcales bacterium]|nr:hypothetical protein [Methylococcales bacterium]
MKFILHVIKSLIIALFLALIASEFGNSFEGQSGFVMFYSFPFFFFLVLIKKPVFSLIFSLIRSNPRVPNYGKRCQKCGQVNSTDKTSCIFCKMEEGLKDVAPEDYLNSAFELKKGIYKPPVKHSSSTR